MNANVKVILRADNRGKAGEGRDEGDELGRYSGEIEAYLNTFSYYNWFH